MFQERDGRDVVVVKSKSTRVCDVSGTSGSGDDIDSSGSCSDSDAHENKEWVFPASMPPAPRASDWERRITISLTLPQALGIIFVALAVVVVVWRLRKSKYQLLQAAAVAAALEKQKQEQQQLQQLNPVVKADINADSSAVPPAPSPEMTYQLPPLPNFSRDPIVTADPFSPLSNPHPVKHHRVSALRANHLNRTASESDLTLPLRAAGAGLNRKDVLGRKVELQGLGKKADVAVVESKTVDTLTGAKGRVEGKFWKDGQESSSGSDSHGLSDWENSAMPRGGSDDEESKREIEFIQFCTAETDCQPEKSPAFSDVSTLPRNSSASPSKAIPRNSSASPSKAVPRNSSASPSTGMSRESYRRRLSENDLKAEAAATANGSSPPHFTSFDAIFMPSQLSSIEAELNQENPKRGGSKGLSRDGSGSSSGNTPHSTPKASPQVKSRSGRDTTTSPLPFDLALVGGGGGKKRPIKLDIPQFERTPTNHYKTTFEEIKPVGQGGFGSVFQVRGRVDNRLYAVKKVKLPKNDAVLKRKMMRETVMMSTLSHMNIVRYHTAWEEHVLNSELEPPSNGNDSRSSWGLSTSITDRTDFSDPDAGSDNVVPVLFIQMEWCDISVKHWLEKRTVVNLSDVHSMFVQLLMGIHHMHDQGIKHFPKHLFQHFSQVFCNPCRSDTSRY